MTKGVMPTVLHHVLFIADGNGRWATSRGLEREAGHMEGMKRIPDVVEECRNQHIRYASFFLFSTENWKRPQREVEGVFKAIELVIADHLETWLQQGVRLRHIGYPHRLTSSLRRTLEKAQAVTHANRDFELSMVIDYGSRDDIVRALQQIQATRLPGEQITEETIASYLSSADLPAPDLLVRTGGRWRISNFFLWEISYAELWFTDILWPDFGREQVRYICEEVRSRQRTFGNVPAEVGETHPKNVNISRA